MCEEQLQWGRRAPEVMLNGKIIDVIAPSLYGVRME